MNNDDLESVAARAATKAVADYTARNPEKCLSQEDAQKLVEETVKSTLLQIGIDSANPLELQQDFQHLRQWRKASADLRSKGMGALIVAFVMGLLSLIGLGIKHWFSQP